MGRFLTRARWNAARCGVQTGSPGHCHGRSRRGRLASRRGRLASRRGRLASRFGRLASRFGRLASQVCGGEGASAGYSGDPSRPLACAKIKGAAMTEITVTDQAGVRHVAIDRPAKRNALTRAMYWALAAALAGAAEAGARAIWLHGSSECFTAGNDLGDFARAVPGERSAAWDFLEALIPCATPIVASVNGAAVGVGTTMLLHCDLVYCSADARFQLPFVNLGLCPEAASQPVASGPRRAVACLRVADAGRAVRRCDGARGGDRERGAAHCGRSRRPCTVPCTGVGRRSRPRRCEPPGRCCAAAQPP